MRSWGEAWEEALYGPGGFFRREVPADHFRTNAHVPLFAEAVRRLAGLVDDALGRPDPFDVVDVGAGRGELLAALPDVPARWRLTGVEVAVPPEQPRAAPPAPPPPAPSGSLLPSPVTTQSALRASQGSGREIIWATEVPTTTGLLLANEWLDSVPLDVLEDGRLVLVADDGSETLGAPLASAWADDWWPPAPAPAAELSGPERARTRPGPDNSREGGPRHRVEVGASRDLAWAAAVARVERGLAVAVDYGHTRADRRPTLTGYRHGRQVPPVPDGSCDLTAHVALDAVAAASGSVVLRQRDALTALGVSAALPDASSPSYALDLARCSQARELLDPGGLGGFGWVARAVGCEVGWMGL